MKTNRFTVNLDGVIYKPGELEITDKGFKPIKPKKDVALEKAKAEETAKLEAEKAAKVAEEKKAKEAEKEAKKEAEKPAKDKESEK